MAESAEDQLLCDMATSAHGKVSHLFRMVFDCFGLPLRDLVVNGGRSLKGPRIPCVPVLGKARSE